MARPVWLAAFHSRPNTGRLYLSIVPERSAHPCPLEQGNQGGSGTSDRLDWVERERSKKRYNLGDYDVIVGQDTVTIRSKTPTEWGKSTVLKRPGTKASITSRPGKSLRIFYLAYALFILVFSMFFVTTEVSEPTQIQLVGLALALILIPFALYMVLPAWVFVGAIALHFVVLFSLPGSMLLETAFKTIEESVGQGNVETFIIAASLLPVILHIMLEQTMVRYTLTLEEGGNVLRIPTWNSHVKALVQHVNTGAGKPGIETLLKRFFLMRLPSYFLKLGRHRMKNCSYCDKVTLTECVRCHTPICDEHTETLRGYKVCPECQIERRGKLRDGLRQMNR